MNIKLSNEVLADVYANCNTVGRQAIKDELGDKLSEILPVTSRVKTFKDACDELGEDHEAVKAYHDIAWKLGKGHEDLLAYIELRIITAALNEEWRPQFVEDEQRWYCWYNLISKEDFDEMDDEKKTECLVVDRTNYNAYAVGGLVYSNANDVSSYTSGGSRLAFKTEELAEYAAKQFIDIYADYCYIPATKERE